MIENYAGNASRHRIVGGEELEREQTVGKAFKGGGDRRMVTSWRYLRRLSSVFSTPMVERRLAIVPIKRYSGFKSMARIEANTCALVRSQDSFAMRNDRVRAVAKLFRLSGGEKA